MAKASRFFLRSLVLDERDINSRAILKAQSGKVPNSG